MDGKRRHNRRAMTRSSVAPGGIRYSAVRYRVVMTRCASDVTGESSLLHHVACRENATTSAFTSSVAGS
jgi:hypothetical protein